MKTRSFAVMAMAALSLLMVGCKEQKAPIKVCIFPGDYPDPTILRDGSDYYMTHSNFTYYPGLLIWHSTDLLHWEPIARAVTSIIPPAAVRTLWLPPISRRALGVNRSSCV